MQAVFYLRFGGGFCLFAGRGGELFVVVWDFFCLVWFRFFDFEGFWGQVGF